MKMNCPKCDSNLISGACLRCGYNSEAKEIYMEHNIADGKVNSARIIGLFFGVIAAIVFLTGIIVFAIPLFK